MPKLADMLCQSVNNSSDFDSAWYVRFAFNLKVDVSQAHKIFSKYGKGYIYAPGGFAMPDTPYQRRKMVTSFGACVVVEANGETWVRTPEQIGSKNRKRAKRIEAQERHKNENVQREYNSQKERERTFHDGQGEACPKRGGKGNSHSDIGKYANDVHKIGMSDQERWSMPRLHIIRVNI